MNDDTNENADVIKCQDMKDLQRKCFHNSQRLETIKFLGVETRNTFLLDKQIAELQFQLLQNTRLLKSYREKLDKTHLNMERTSKQYKIIAPMVQSGDPAIVKSISDMLEASESKNAQIDSVVSNLEKRLKDELEKKNELESIRPESQKNYLLNLENKKLENTEHVLEKEKQIMTRLDMKYNKCGDKLDQCETNKNILLQQLNEATSEYTKLKNELTRIESQRQKLSESDQGNIKAAVDALEVNRITIENMKKAYEQSQNAFQEYRNDFLEKSILAMKIEQKQLEKKLADAERSEQEARRMAPQPDYLSDDACSKKKTEIAHLFPFVTRQVQIYDIISENVIKNENQTDNNNDDVLKIFLEKNSNTFEEARVIQANISENLDCKTISLLHGQLVKISKSMRHLDSSLVNLYEDISGAVRVYVRIKPSKDRHSTVFKEGKKLKFNGNFCVPALPLKTYGRFFNVISDTFTNADAFTGCKGTLIDNNTYVISGTEENIEPGATCCLANDAAGVCRVVNQVKDGYHVSFFGYGFSGSGKTMTLFGNYGNSTNDSSSKEYSQPGIAQLAIANSNATHVALKSVFELASHQIDLRDKSFSSGIFIELFHQGDSILKTLPIEMLKKEENEFAKYGEQFYRSHKTLIHDIKKDGISATQFNELIIWVAEKVHLIFSKCFWTNQKINHGKYQVFV
ncbi:hypothetical protein BDK51DRAFT_31149 [Blyttiomyces helicus]|uniref:Kinesin motor domain-containing protein n=1 Tax=Blyttiomyces helicus TaxID=388810 RepID=A0A4P9WP75_9FUNG|nr:hypothetical protein BDK51DRAFT_31149 [Blyttiomyces helicus]|eukprot:RKO92596.1 hypothetical protein BDK51DRAFT_31149 [Blyttiomyces helicus]